MIRLLFGYMPWWLYAAGAVFFGWVTFMFWEDYQNDQRQGALAQVLGPPELVRVRDYVIGRTPQALGEVYVSGLIRADLGIIEAGDENGRRTYIILGGENRRGPLIALQARPADAQDMIDRVVSAADAEGRVEVRGFVTNSYKSDLATALRSRGASVAPEIVQPYFGNRQEAISDRQADGLTAVLIGAGITALMALISAFKFWRWRTRRAERKATGAAQPAAQPANPRRAQAATPPPSNPAAPWGAQTSRVQQAASPMAAPAPRPLPPDTARAPSAPAAADIPTSLPQKVGGVRIKTPEEIIRQAFGKSSTARLSAPKPTDQG